MEAHVFALCFREQLVQAIARRDQDMPECFGFLLKLLADLDEVFDCLLEQR